MKRFIPIVYCYADLDLACPALPRPEENPDYYSDKMALLDDSDYYYDWELEMAEKSK
jgi:hypothetical protein